MSVPPKGGVSYGCQMNRSPLWSPATRDFASMAGEPGHELHKQRLGAIVGVAVRQFAEQLEQRPLAEGMNLPR
jgi:hypothetical protein